MSAPERTRPIHVPAAGPPQVNRPSPEILEAIGQEGVFRMLADFYGELEQTELRRWFPEDMEAASERSAAFFVQLLGGPPLFNERYGPPRMRMRHFPFEIDESARRIWLDAFDRVIDSAPATYGFPAEHVEGFRAFLDGFSTWMVNVAPDETPPS
jgi:hemoglobin